MSNVLVILMDDMRYDELKYMPNTRRMLAGRGTTFTQCRTNVPLCSPSRGAVYTGQLSKDSGLETNSDIPDTTQFNNSAFVPINTAGYRVGMVGKFFIAAVAGSVRPGFDTWRALVGDTGSGFGIYDTTGYEIYDGSSTIEPTSYQDHYFAGQAVDFIRGSEPWCLWYCPTSPHYPNFDGPPNHTTEWALSDFPITYETDVADKPSWIQALSAPSDEVKQQIQDEQRVRRQELLAADDAIGAMVATIDATGQSDDTTVIFTSDNGVALGEHRIYGNNALSRTGRKNLLYDVCMHVPLVCYGPGFDRATVTAPTTLQDVTATMHDVTGTTALLSDQAGVSLVDIAADPTTYLSRQLLHFRDDAGSNDGFPNADAITTSTRKLIRHQGETGTDEFELYDLENDPNELTNRANDGGSWATELSTLETALDALLA